MAKFKDTLLWDIGSRTRGGAVLYLTSASQEDSTWIPGNGTRVATIAGSRAVVVNGLDSTSAENSLETAFELGNRGLDVLSAGGIMHATLADPTTEHIVWFDSATHMVLRIWTNYRIAVKVGSPSGVVRDAAGNAIPPSNPMTPQWAETFRFFRLAQTTDDLFDAFRNLYLGLEASLSSLEPPGVREREADWLLRALRKASSHVDLAGSLPKGFIGDPAQGIFDEFYVKYRNAIFHAKATRQRYMPRDLEHRAAILNALERLAQLLIVLCENVHGVRFRSSFMSSAGFKLMNSPIATCRIALTDDEGAFDPNLVDLGERNIQTVFLDDVPADKLEEDFFVPIRGRISSDRLQELDYVTRSIAVATNNAPLYAHDLEGRLQLDGIDELEVIMGWRGHNVSTIRNYYTA